MRYRVLVRKRWSTAESFIDAAKCQINGGALAFYDTDGVLLAAMSVGEWSAVERVSVSVVDTVT